MAPEDNTHRAIHRWNQRIEHPMPEWWEWAVAAAQYHLADCDWVTIGVAAGEHCSCCLTRVLAKIIEERRASGDTWKDLYGEGVSVGVELGKALATGGRVPSTDPKTPRDLTMERVLAQLRHAYQLLKDGSVGNWTQRRRMMFADGLIAPQIKRLEELHHGTHEDHQRGADRG